MTGSCWIKEPPDQIALVWEKCRGPDPAAGATILNANVRPYRDDAAAASNENGRGVDHGRGYKAAPALRQGIKNDD
jgi:hypothetical protein